MMTEMEPTAPLEEVFFSYLMRECEQHVLTLSAVGIHTWIKVRDGGFAVMVQEDSLALAQRHLREVAEETQTTQEQSVSPQPATHPNAWWGSVVYALMLMGVSYAAGIGMSGIDWVERGAIQGSIANTHQWWRVFTALTLHADVAHLAGNLVFGIALGYFVSLAVGGGIAWATILFSAALGNTLDALLMPQSHSSIGASTAVFAALGLLSAHAWRRETVSGLRRAKQWAPLVAGVMLLALLGMGGENTDVVAHVTGFICGALVGAVLGRMDQARFKRRGVQVVAAAVALAAVVLAWGWALVLAGRPVSGAT